MNFKVFVVTILFVLISLSACWSSKINRYLDRKILSFAADTNPNLTEAIASGAEMAMQECKNIFKWNRWNCPQSTFSKQTLGINTKEKAFADALVYAGIVYAITERCTKGEIEDCGCDVNNVVEIRASKVDRHPVETFKDWHWGGCSDDPSFGEKIVAKYVEEEGKNGDVQAAIHSHNNIIGRGIIRKTLIRRCKCFGLFGACTMQTCWKELASFSEVARHLHHYYMKAIRVTYEETGGSFAMGNSHRQINLEQNKLYYLDAAKNYCLPDESLGWPGTKGRTCTRNNLGTASGPERRSCRHLCRSCGFKVKKQRITVSKRCNCKFHYCCEVLCDTCIIVEERHFCD